MVRTLLTMGIVLALAGAGSAQEHQYVGVKKCRVCHRNELTGNQYARWQESGHSKAFETLKSPQAIEIGRQRGLAGPPHEAEECLKCHVTAFGVPAAQIRYPVDARDGVQCESCHGPGNDYRKKKVMSDPDLSLAMGRWTPGEKVEICQGCHNDTSPTWDETRFERADGSTAAFDFELAKAKIEHHMPEDVKGANVDPEKE